MKIRGRKVDAATDPSVHGNKNLLQKSQNQGKGSATQLVEQDKVDVSASRILADVQPNNAEKVARLKELYDAGKLSYSGEEVAGKVLAGITDAVAVAQALGGSTADNE